MNIILMSRVRVIIDGVWTGNWIFDRLLIVTTNNYTSLTELRTVNCTEITVHLKHFPSSLDVSW
jgi:hypothetical protein